MRQHWDGDATLDKDLRNWARWACGSSGGPRTNISSLERNYVAPPSPEEKRRGYDPVDEKSAVRMEAAVTRLDRRPKLLVKHYYVYKADPRHTQRRLRITQATWTLEMLSAHRKIAVYFFEDLAYTAPTIQPFLSVQGSAFSPSRRAEALPERAAGLLPVS